MVRQSLLQSDELLFQDALTVEQMRDAFDAEGISFGEPVSVPTGAAPARNPPTDDDGIIDTPGITLWAMRSQALFTNVQRSCRAAVQRVAVSCELRKHTVSPRTWGRILAPDPR